MIKGQGAQVKM